MVNPLAYVRTSLKLLKRTFTGEILRQEEIETRYGVFSLLLKRDRRSLDEYVVLVSRGGGVFYNVFELDELDHFIEAAEAIPASQISAPEASPSVLSAIPVLSGLARMMSRKELSRADTKISGGQVTASLRLKREKTTGHDYVVLAITAPGMSQHYTFELDEFHRFLAAAKRMRATEGAPASAERAGLGTARKVMLDFLQFIGLTAVLFVIWAWSGGDLGYWALPVVVGIWCIPMLLKWALRKRRNAS